MQCRGSVIMPTMPGDVRSPSSVSARTRQAIVDAVRELGSPTRAEIIAATGLSRASVAGGVAELVDLGVVAVHRESGRSGGGGEGEGGRGRRPVRLALVPPAGIVCAIDLGHGHRAIAVADTAGDVLDREWYIDDVDADPLAALMASLEVAQRMTAAHADRGELLAVAVVVPQPVSDGAIVRTPFLTSWHGVGIARHVREVLPVPVVVENDANAAALAECGETGGGLIFVKASTGVGAGIVAAGRLVRGAHGQAGEIGHMVVRPDGQLCGCGNRGCLETLASVPAVLRSLEPIHGALDREGLARLIAAGDVAGARAMRDAGEAIGAALAPVVVALEVERLVIGGLDGIPVDALVEGARARIQALVHRQVAGQLIVGPSAHGALAPLDGAVLLARRAVPVPAVA